MSQSQTAGTQAAILSRSTHPGEEVSIDHYFDILEDQASRAIIEATSERSLSAKEISDACNLPASTTYRKLERMSEAGLLKESIRIKQSGKHTCEYAAVVQDLTVSIGGNGGIELQVQCSQ